MYLDIRTLDVAIIIICSVFGPVSFAFGTGQPYVLPARYWGAALLALAGGLASVNLQAHSPAFVSQLIGPVLFALALTLAQGCARSAGGKGGRDVLGWTLFGFFALAMLAQQYTSNNEALRVFLELELTGLLACKAAYEFDRCRELRETSPMQVIATIFGLLGAVLIVQGVFGSSRLDASATTESDLTLGLMRVGMIAGLLLSTVVLLWVMTESINRKMRDLVGLDPLTGALNRQALIQHVECEISRTRRRTNSRFTIMLLGLDQFRRVNDAHGHHAGDKLPVATVEVLRTTLRDYDLVGRLDGGSFILILPGTWGENAAKLAERAQQDIGRYAAKKALLKNSVSVSVGVSVYGENGEDWTALHRAAEIAMKIAKAAGGNCVVIAATEEAIIPT